MKSSNSSALGGSFSIASVLGIPLGVAVFGYGLLLVPTSTLGGAHVAAIGLSLLLAGLVATEWAGDRFDLSMAARRKLSLAFATLSVVLLVAFVVINFASFEAVETEGSYGGP